MSDADRDVEKGPNRIENGGMGGCLLARYWSTKETAASTRAIPEKIKIHQFILCPDFPIASDLLASRMFIRWRLAFICSIRFNSTSLRIKSICAKQNSDM
jgi:hypothetical protein